MQSLRQIAGRIKAAAQARIRAFKFRSAVRQLEAIPAGKEVPESLLNRLILGWNNEAWSGSLAFLRASLDAIARTDGPILECGSGLSTIVVGWAAKRANRPLLAIEHSAPWAKVVMKHITRHRLDNVRVCHVDLCDFGEFDWYGVPPDDLPRNIGLVICDGPPGSTVGGRYGLLPRMRSHLAPDCVVLLDDAGRSAEQAILARWRHEFQINCEILEPERTVGLIRFDK